MYILTIPSCPNKDRFCVRDLSPWADEQKTVWKSHSALRSDQSPASGQSYPVLEHYLTRLSHPCPGLPSDSTCARGGLQSQATGFLRKRESEAGAKFLLPPSQSNPLFFKKTKTPKLPPPSPHPQKKPKTPKAPEQNAQIILDLICLMHRNHCHGGVSKYVLSFQLEPLAFATASVCVRGPPYYGAPYK